MPIALDDSGFIIWTDASQTPSLGLDSDQLSECIAEVNRRDLKGVFGTVPYFREPDLNFLNQLPSLTAAAFWDITLNDISGLYGLSHLTYLRISGKRPPLEFERLQSLRILVWEYGKRDSGVDRLGNLEELYLWRYRTPDKNAFELKLPDNLKELRIFWSNVETLDILESLPNLTTLELGRCRNLKFLVNLDEAFPKLETLIVTASGKLTADEAKRAIEDHPTLRFVFAGNQRLLKVGGDVDTLPP